MERMPVGFGAPYSDIEYAIHVARYLPLRDLVRGKSVLDASCGEGYACGIMADQWGAKSVVGVDRSADAIAVATAHFSAPALTFVESSLEQYLARAADDGVRFDVIVSVETIEHVDDPVQVIRGFKSLLAPDGLIYLTIPNDIFYFGAGQRSLNKYHKHVFDFAAARSLAEDILGPGEWALGSVANGFSCIRLDEMAVVSAFGPDPGAVRPAIAGIIPAMPANQLSPETALYYAGCWNFGGDGRVPSVSTIYPANSEYRVPQLNHAAPVVDGLPLRVAMVADVEGWAFDNIAKNLRSVLGDRVSIDILYLKDTPMPALFAKLFLEGKYDHAHFLWREPILHSFFSEQFTRTLLRDLEKTLNLDAVNTIARLAHGIGATTLTFGVYDHLALEDDDIAARQAGVALVDGYSVCSARLHRIYTDRYGVCPTIGTPDGVDRSVFRPKGLERFSATDRPLVVGWVGNSGWNRSDHGDEPKGLETVLKPALEQLAEEGIQIRQDIADRKDHWRPREQMPDYYAGIDVLVCTSRIEGTPNPVLEAMACGVPIVSTDVGIVPEVLGPLQSRFIVPRRIEDVAGAIRKLHADRTLLVGLSQENINRIETREWIDQAPNWLYLFDKARAEHLAGRGRARAAYLSLFLNTVSASQCRGKSGSRRRKLDAAYLKKKIRKFLRTGRI